MQSKYFKIFSKNKIYFLSSSNLDSKNGTDCCSTLIRTGITETDFGNFTSKLFLQYNFTNVEVIYSEQV